MALNEFGFQEELSSCLPSRFLDEPETETEQFWETKKYHNKHHHSHHQRLPLHPQQLRTKSRPRPHSINWGSGGSGMQAIFLDSGQKSCGTGVFLPRRAGATLQPNKKPACSPVLLPARVVHALNLNVHEIGLQISRRQDAKTNSKVGDCNSLKNKNKDASAQCCVIAQNENSSSDIFLPKEWTYYY
ncbi:uncharacterized protein [Euphorbia lathyris]|uniref:uncharacterized protein isoform X2 n=1 Tax=Euphorbia lathyris TaxID=212925 RepID=UPI003313CF26